MPHPAQGKYFAYAHRDIVRIIVSGETGEIVSRMDSTDTSDQYQVRYRDAQGIACERWWAESALELPD